MADPVAIITYTDTPIDPTTLPQNVVLSGSTSTPGDGSSITGYQWHLLDKPPGSTAVLTDATTATCTLTGVDLVGTYRLFLVVQNNLGDFSFQEPNPQQLAVAPYSFSAPPASAFKTVTVETDNAGLIKVAYGERTWLERGLWPVVDEVDALRGEHDTLRTDFDSHTIADHDTTATGAQLSALTAGASSNASSLHTHNSLPNVTIGDAEVTGFFLTNQISERTLGSGVTVDGVLLKDSVPYVPVGGSSTKREPVSAIDATWDGGPTSSASYQLMGTITLPSGALTKAGLVRGQVCFKTAANGNNKRMVLDFDGTLGFDQTVTSNDSLFVLDFVIVRTGTNTQRAYVWGVGGVAITPSETLLTLSEAGTIRVFIRGETASGAGDLTLLWYDCTGEFDP